MKLLATADQLDAKKIERNADVDPILYTLTAAHDMGNVNGLFMSNLRSTPGGELLLDSQRAIENDPPEHASTQQVILPSDILEQLQSIADESPNICPKLMGFSFQNRKDGAFELLQKGALNN